MARVGWRGSLIYDVRCGASDCRRPEPWLFHRRIDLRRWPVGTDNIAERQRRTTAGPSKGRIIRRESLMAQTGFGTVDNIPRAMGVRWPRNTLSIW